MMTITPSPWDSEVFGFKVGILKASSQVFLHDVRTAGAAFDVIFVKNDTWVDPGEEVYALDYQFEMELKSLGDHIPASPLSAMTASFNHMEIAMTAFPDSRFLRDCRLQDCVPHLYTRWLMGKPVFALERSPEIAFLLVSTDEDGANRISLIAVDQNLRSSGVGRLLVGGVLRELRGIWRVSVSARNYKAIRFYENLGFRVKSVRTTFHVWNRNR